VLVADDNRDAADSLAAYLRHLGHEVRVAYDGQEAVQLSADFAPNVALVDIGMPSLSGHDVARRFRSEKWGQHTRLIAVTGWGQEEDRRRSKEAGFDQHVVKPLDLEKIEHILNGEPAA
jgi:CheY-like chemotaxis protein